MNTDDKLFRIFIITAIVIMLSLPILGTSLHYRDAEEFRIETIYHKKMNEQQVMIFVINTDGNNRQTYIQKIEFRDVNGSLLYRHDKKEKIVSRDIIDVPIWGIDLHQPIKIYMFTNSRVMIMRYALGGFA